MTGQEWINIHMAKIQALDTVFVEAVASTHEMMDTRIFEDGENAAGGKIGNYATSPGLYVNPKSAQVRKKSFTPKGKTGKTKFEDGEPYKTRWFDSYNKFQHTQPFASSSVNLRLTNNLRSDFQNSLTVRGKLLASTGVKSDENEKKVEGFETKYGSIFALSEKEKEHFYKTAQAKSVEFLNRD